LIISYFYFLTTIFLINAKLHFIFIVFGVKSKQYYLSSFLRYGDMIRNPFFYSKPTSYSLQVGNILVSVPLSGDFYFNRTVVLLVDHNEKGSFGIILNKSLPVTLQDIFKNNRKKSDSISIFNGGPVEIDNLFALHTYGNLIKESSQVTDELYFGGSPSELLQFIKDDSLDENLIRFYLGYTGWSKGQLESEITKNLWVIGQFQEKLLFHNNDEICWKTAVDSLGKEYNSWLNITKEPYLN
jgi:putative transcriptional regulator